MPKQTLDVERVILVNDFDQEIGTEEKLRAHELTLLHRAFSIFLFNSAGEILLQRRSELKYLNGGGIQYALISGRWAAEYALGALADDDLSQSRLTQCADRSAR